MMRLLPLALLLLLTSGCLLDASTGSVQTVDDITVAVTPPNVTITNDRAEPVALTIIETELSHLVDLAPCEMRRNFQAPGERVSLGLTDIDGYTEQATSFRVFWCTLDPAHSGMVEVPLD